MAHRWISSFLDSFRSEGGGAENSVLAYGRDLLEFESFLNHHKPPKSFETVGKTEVESYLMHLETKGLAESSRGRHLSTIKQFYRFLYEENWVKTNPTQLIRAPKKKRTLPSVLSQDDIKRAADRLGAHRTNRPGTLAQSVYVAFIIRHGHAGERADFPAINVRKRQP